MAKKTKTLVIVREETAAIVRTIAMAGKKTVAVVKKIVAVKTIIIMGTLVAVETMVAVIWALKVFRKKSIIAVKKETAIVAAKALKKDSTANFNGKKKYIWINGNVMAFIWGERETTLAGAWRE